MGAVTSEVKLIDGGDTPAPAAKGLSPEIAQLFEDLIKINCRGKNTPRLFQNRLPSGPAGKPSKALITAAQKIRSIYDGRFLREYPSSQEFLKRNSHLVQLEAVKGILAGVKGDMAGTLRLVFEAARNYRQWWWQENEPEKKDWLPRDLSMWLYNAYSQQSVFLACLAGPPNPLRETAADRLYESLPVEICDAARELYQKSWGADRFWGQIKGVVDWYYGPGAEVRAQDTNAAYWFGYGLEDWFGRYVRWLKDLGGGDGRGLYLKQIGPGNATWAAWLSYGAGKHNIGVDMGG